MSDVQHTPTPWTIDKLPTRIVVADRQGFVGWYRVADAHQSAQLANTPRHEEAAANAAFIVKAANNHDNLVTTLQLARQHVAHTENGTLLTIIDAALAKAGVAS